jgi:ATP-dependent DNA helicase RecG
LISEHLVEKENQYFKILNLGAILFANNLEDFPEIKRKALRVILYKGNDRLHTIKEKQEIMGYAVAFEKIITYINEQLPQNEIIGSTFRQEVKMYPEIAIRELVANALIHQDFSESGTNPMVEIFQNRIEITSPGKPIIDTLRFIDHTPKSRNETLTSFMRRINICEERGSGIDKVISQIEVYQLPAPTFNDENNYLKVTLFGHRPLNKMDKDDKIRACYQHCCLRYVMSEFVTNSSLRNRFQVKEKNYPIISKIIADTVQAGLIKPYDFMNKAKKHAKYIPFLA